MKIRDVSLFVNIMGQGYPLLLMHGGPGLDHTSLLPLRPLADQFTLIFYDHRCNGRSEGAGFGVGTLSGLAEVGSNVVSYTDTNVVAGGRYDYQVRAWNGAGPSGFSAPATGTAPGSPAQPSIAVVSNAPISFQFGTTPGRTSLVEYAESLPAPQWILLQTVLGDGSPSTVTDTSTPTGQRYYRVRMP